MSQQVLKFLRTYEVEPAEGIVPRTKFIQGKVIDGVKIRYVSHQFIESFGPQYGPTQGITEPVTLRVHEVTEAAFEWVVREELGADVALTIDHYWWLAKNVHRDFTCYLADRAGMVWMVNTCWPSYGSGGLMASIRETMKPHAKHAVVSSGDTIIISR